MIPETAKPTIPDLSSGELLARCAAPLSDSLSQWQAAATPRVVHGNAK
jgi:hypothetical protein